MPLYSSGERNIQRQLSLISPIESPFYQAKKVYHESRAAMPPRDIMFSVPDEEERSVQILTISFEDDTDEGIALCSVSSSEAESIALADELDNQNDNDNDDPTNGKTELLFGKTHHKCSHAFSPPLLDEHRDDKDNDNTQAIVRQESNDDLSDDEVLVVETFSEVVSPPHNQKLIVDMSVQGSLVVGILPENGNNTEETGSSSPSNGNRTLTPTQHSNKQDSVVNCVREQYGKEENFKTDEVSDDLERFYLSQRARCEAYQQKKRDTLILNHEALDIRRSTSCESNQSPGSLPTGFARQAFEGGFSAHVFVIHDRHGLLMKKVSSNPETKHQYQIPGGVVDDCDFATAGKRPCVSTHTIISTLLKSSDHASF